MALLLYPEFIGTRTYQAQQLRRLNEHLPLQEGVYGAGDCKVTPGAGLQLSVAAGGAWVKGDTGTRQGLYHVENDAAATVTVGAAHGSLPRIDQVILTIFDSTVAGGSDAPTLSVLAGTATAGATLENRTGAAALPNDAIRFADVLVPAGFAGPFVQNTHIRDRRPFARGFYNTTTGQAAGNYSTGLGTFGSVDATRFKYRIETSGVPIEIDFNFDWSMDTTNAIVVAVFIDGVGAREMADRADATSLSYPFHFNWTTSLAAGSHTIDMQWRVTAGNAVMANNALRIPVMSVREVVRQKVDNSGA